MRRGRLAVGCLIGLVALVAGGVALVSWAAGTPLPDLFATWREVRRVDTLRDDPRLQASWTPAEEAMLSVDQIERWLDVQRAVRSAFEPHLEGLSERAEAIEAGDAGPLETLRAATDAARLVAAAGVAHGEALLEAGFTLDEYRWTRDRIVRAADLDLRTAEFERAREALGGQVAPDVDALPSGSQEVDADAAAEERERLAPYRDEIRENLAFAWFGL